MANRYACFVLSLASIASVCLAYPKGAPPGACATMKPNHAGINALPNSNAPFEVVAQVGPNRVVTVSLLSLQPGKPFKGFMVNAVDAQDQLTGKFTSATSGKTLDCDYEASTATHSSGDAEFKEVLTWEPTTPDPVTVTFRATFVEGYSHFYVQLKSEPVTA